MNNPHPIGTDAYWETHVRNVAITVYHPVGTVAMGSDPTIAALSPDLKVRRMLGRMHEVLCLAVIVPLYV